MGVYSAIMSSLVACLLADVVAMLATSVTLVVDAVAGVDDTVAKSTPTKLPKSVSDDFVSGSGDATHVTENIVYNNSNNNNTKQK